MDTPQLIARCGWRFYAGKFLNAARFGADWRPYAAPMATKVFYELRTARLLSSDAAQALLSTSVQEAYSRFGWRFGSHRYDPQLFSYGPDNRLLPFDVQKQLSISPVPEFRGNFWNFVEQQCKLDETRPQVFGEAVRVRYAISERRSLLVRFTFNHALVDGLEIFRFLAAWEKSIARSGHEMCTVELGADERVRRWQTHQTEYVVEDLSQDTVPDLAQRGANYLVILYEIIRHSRYKNVRQAVAVPRNGLIQLALAPVCVSRDYEEFCCRNEMNIRDAQSGNRFTRLLDLYRRYPEIGDLIARGLIGDPLLGRRIIARMIGDLVVSAFMIKHPCSLVFPVAHALQREGVAICCTWSRNGRTIVRLTRARKLR